MPFIRSLAFKRFIYYSKLIIIIFLLDKIIPIYFYYAKKKLVYIIIITFFSCQPSFYFKYTKLNIYFFYNVQLVSNTKYIFLISVILFHFPHSLDINI